MDYNYRLNTLLKRRLNDSKGRLEYYKLKMSHLSPVSQIREKRQMLIDFEEKLNFRIQMAVREYRHRADVFKGRLTGLSPLAKLKGGYSYVEDKQGRALISAGQVQTGETINIHLYDGQVTAEVTSARTERRTKDGEEQEY